jgi:N4-gp56 family major capsid protein
MAGNVPYGSLTGTSAISNLVQTAYDQYVRMALRSIPVMRALADVKPVQQAMPGSSVVFSIYSDLAQATTTLTETSDVSSIALGNPNQITVTLNEYGSAVTTTKKLNMTSFNDVDAALADIIAYNAADSIDAVVASVLTGAGSTNIIYAGTSGATSTNTITATDKMQVANIREAVTELRTNKALPRIGELYTAYLHPRQTADLRAETGTGGFQALTQYVDRTPFTAGAVGVIEGAFVVETPRVPYSANTQSPSVNVYKAVIAGREALAEAQGQDISTVVGPQIDALRRYHTIGWYYFGGFNILRTAALYQIQSAATNG